MYDNSAWFQKYYPKTIDDYVFSNPYHKQKVKTWLDQGFIDGNLLLYGPAGTGKTSLIRILQNNLIKNSSDFISIDKKENIDDILTNGFITSKSKYSKKRIVVIEEIDNTHYVFKGALKNRLLELYQDNVSFICSTNYLNKLDDAIRRRFNHKFNVINTNIKDVCNRIFYILNNENIKYNESDIKDIISNKINIGICNLITYFQTSVVNENNTLLLNFQQDLDFITEEDNVVQITLNIISKLLELQFIAESDKTILKKYPIKSASICNEYKKLLELIMYDYEINFDRILLELINRIDYIPILNVLSSYDNIFETKKIKWMTYIKCISEIIDVIIDV